MKELKFRGMTDSIGMVYTSTLNDMQFWNHGTGAPEVLISDVGLMQFVGIVDNDGVDVYEGDIVLTPDCGDVFDDWIVVVDIEYGGYALRSPQNEDYHEFIGDFIHDMKVIGNIWENPDLLKEAE